MSQINPERNLSEVLVFGLLHILHIYFLQSASFLPVDNTRGRVLGSQELPFTDVFFASPLPGW